MGGHPPIGVRQADLIAGMGGHPPIGVRQADLIAGMGGHPPIGVRQADLFAGMGGHPPIGVRQAAGPPGLAGEPAPASASVTGAPPARGPEVREGTRYRPTASDKASPRVRPPQPQTARRPPRARSLSTGRHSARRPARTVAATGDVARAGRPLLGPDCWSTRDVGWHLGRGQSGAGGAFGRRLASTVAATGDVARAGRPLPSPGCWSTRDVGWAKPGAPPAARCCGTSDAPSSRSPGAAQARLERLGRRRLGRLGRRPPGHEWRRQARRSFSNQVWHLLGESQRLTVRVSSRELHALNELVAAWGGDRSEVVRRAIREAAAKARQQRRQALLHALPALTVVQLRSLATELDIQGRSRMTSPELRSAVRTVLRR